MVPKANLPPFEDLNTRLLADKKVVEISSPPIEALTNLANPLASITAFGVPSAGVEILLAAKAPWIVTSDVIDQNLQ